MASRRRQLLKRGAASTQSTPPYLVIQTIGKALQEQYEPPKELPHRLLTLLLQINEREDNS
jgi:hypothetical protein